MAAAYLIQANDGYNTVAGRTVNEPMTTVAFGSGHGALQGVPYYIVDITLRMLAPHELYKAQGFPDDYIITHGDGRQITKTAQVRMCGNSVSPPRQRHYSTPIITSNPF